MGPVRGHGQVGPIDIADLKKRAYSAEQIARALHAVGTEAKNPNLCLYDNNRRRVCTPGKTQERSVAYSRQSLGMDSFHQPFFLLVTYTPQSRVRPAVTGLPRNGLWALIYKR